MRFTNPMIRSVGTAVVTVFLVAGAAFATSSFVAGGRTDDGIPASTMTDATATPEPNETAKPEKTPEAGKTPDDHGGADNDNDNNDHATAGPTDDYQGEDHGSSGHDNGGGDAHDDGSHDGGGHGSGHDGGSDD